MRNHEPNDIVFEAFSDLGIVSGASAVLGRIEDSVFRSLPTATRSVTRMAKDYVMQFPMIASAAIPDDDFNAIVKNCEMQYSQFISMVLTGVSGLSTKDIRNTSDIIKLFHSNDDDLGSHLLDYAMTCEGAVVEDPKFRVQFTKDDMAALAYGTDEELTIESLNDMYHPNEAMLKKYEKAALAMEAHKIVNARNNVKGLAREYKEGIARNKELERNNQMTADNLAKREARLKDEEGRLGDHIADLYDDTQELNAGRTQIDKDKADYAAKKHALDYDTKKRKQEIRKAKLDIANNSQNRVSASDLNKIQDNGDAPVVLTATVYLDTEGDAIPRTLIFGVKVMPRRIPSSVMVPQIVQTLTSNSLAFTFVRYTKGEVKLVRDLILDISSARAEALNHVDNKRAGQWFAAVQRRKRNSKLARWIPGQNCAPTMTIVMTDTEADAVKASCGIDLTDDASACKFMHDMYLLGFVLYNTANNSVSVMFDGYSNGRFYNSTISGLTAQTKSAPRLDMKTINQVAQMARGL